MIETQKEENYEQKEISGDHYVCVYDIVAAAGDSICRDNRRCAGWTAQDPGTAVAGTTLKADMQGIKNEGITEDSVSYQWFRKTSDDERKNSRERNLN